MKVIKRTLCLLLSLVMVIGMFPMQAFATVDGLELMETAPVAELPLLEPLPVPEIVPAEIPAEFVDTALPELPVLPEAGGEAAPFREFSCERRPSSRGAVLAPRD